MNSNNYWDGNSIAGMAGGTLCTLAVTVPATELFKTIVLAAVGAVVSFGVSFLLKTIVSQSKKGGK
ncbi:hypothetical protein SAMN05421788_101551 [Filimonas lacunae]|uniref:Uncharacterized protein n=1 Tax=Filimonas lacunae TaxID=477680 RepID=A0A173MNN7_9BACT|nr:hypothetical protein [Filimonas lacunae]BAV09106.1 hypothetical protein FLA_5154 [Filimonas lacunae]SIS67367.1 hypothetical protein SAMN05421788_101551 [Filimonas lacunae]